MFLTDSVNFAGIYWIIFLPASIRDYDVGLCRLKCYQDDVYRGITPNTDALDFNPEPPVFACRFCTTQGYEQILALANEDGKIALQDTNVRMTSNQQLEGTQVLTLYDIRIQRIRIVKMNA